MSSGIKVISSCFLVLSSLNGFAQYHFSFGLMFTHSFGEGGPFGLSLQNNKYIAFYKIETSSKKIYLYEYDESIDLFENPTLTECP